MAYKKITPRQVLDLALEHPELTQEELGDSLGCAQNTITGKLKSAKISFPQDYEEYKEKQAELKKAGEMHHLNKKFTPRQVLDSALEHPELMQKELGDLLGYEEGTIKNRLGIAKVLFPQDYGKYIKLKKEIHDANKDARTKAIYDKFSASEQAQELYKKNIRLLDWFKKQKNIKNNLDAENAAEIGYIKACVNYNPEGAKFSTFAAKLMSNEIGMYFRSVHADEKSNIKMPDSLDATLPNTDNLSLRTIIADKTIKPVEEDVENRIVKVHNISLKNALSQLKQEDATMAKAVIFRFVDKWEPDEIAEELKISSADCEKVLLTGLAKLKEYMVPKQENITPKHMKKQTL